MKSELKVCTHCRRSVTLRFRDFEDIGFHFHWVGDYYHIDVVLIVDGIRCCLFGEVYAFESAE